jgi:ABC-type transport system involved in Fe-S cluster assembly fused permease/ATPase subunit
VETGPLTGARGIFCSVEEKRRIVISVTLLQRSVAVHLDENTMISVVEDSKEVKENKVILGDRSDIALKLMKRTRNIPIVGD